jgi:hypothetical protein
VACQEIIHALLFQIEALNRNPLKNTLDSAFEYVRLKIKIWLTISC